MLEEFSYYEEIIRIITALLLTLFLLILPFTILTVIYKFNSINKNKVITIVKKKPPRVKD